MMQGSMAFPIAKMITAGAIILSMLVFALEAHARGAERWDAGDILDRSEAIVVARAGSGGELGLIVSSLRVVDVLWGDVEARDEIFFEEGGAADMHTMAIILPGDSLFFLVRLGEERVRRINEGLPVYVKERPAEIWTLVENEEQWMSHAQLTVLRDDREEEARSGLGIHTEHRVGVGPAKFVAYVRRLLSLREDVRAGRPVPPMESLDLYERDVVAYERGRLEVAEAIERARRGEEAGLEVLRAKLEEENLTFANATLPAAHRRAMALVASLAELGDSSALQWVSSNDPRKERRVETIPALRAFALHARERPIADDAARRLFALAEDESALVRLPAIESLRGLPDMQIDDERLQGGLALLERRRDEDPDPEVRAKAEEVLQAVLEEIERRQASSLTKAAAVVAGTLVAAALILYAVVKIMKN